MSDLYVDTEYWDDGYTEWAALSGGEGSGGGGGGKRKEPKYNPGLTAVPKIKAEKPAEVQIEEPPDPEFEAWFARTFYPTGQIH